MNVLIQNQLVTLTKPVGSPGGQATVYEIPNDPDHVAKIYEVDWRTPEQAQKNDFLIRNPLTLSVGTHRASQLRQLVLDTGGQTPIGIVIDRVHDSVELANVLNNPHVPLTFKLQTALNLARYLNDIHKLGYARGDLSPSNDLVNAKAETTAIDNDSLQVVANGVSMRCGTGVMDYQPPELQGQALEDVDHTELHDRFGFGVLVFLLLMDGTHPFDCIYNGPGTRPRLYERIATPGYFPYCANAAAGVQPKVSNAIYTRLPSTVRDLFTQCFDVGHSNPGVRPRAIDWIQTLEPLCAQPGVSLPAHIWCNVVDPNCPVIQPVQPAFTVRGWSFLKSSHFQAATAGVIAGVLATGVVTKVRFAKSPAPSALQVNALDHTILSADQRDIDAGKPIVSDSADVVSEESHMNSSRQAAGTQRKEADAPTVREAVSLSDLASPENETPGIWAAIRDGKEIEW